MSDTDIFSVPLEARRKVIDEADIAILEALAKRFEATDAIGRLKQSEGLPIYDASREAAILEAHTKLAEQYNVTPEFIAELWAVILKESRRRQGA